MSHCAQSDSGIQVVKQNAVVAIIILLSLHIYLSIYIHNIKQIYN